MSHPWQEREDRGYPRAFVETVLVALRSPRAFFAETSGSHGLRGPLLFGVTAEVLGEILQFLLIAIVALAFLQLTGPASG